MPPAASTSAQAMSNLQNFQSGMQTPDQTRTQTEQSLGVPAAQAQVQGLRGAINNTTSLLQQVAPSVMGRTQNSLVTSAQANRQIGNEQAPIQADLTRDQTDYTGASSDLNNLISQANTQTSDAQAGQNSKLSYLEGIYNNLYTQEQDAAKEAEATRQFNEQLAASKAASAASASAASPTFGSAASSNGTISKDASGGYKVVNSSGQPITLGQYAAANGLGIAQISQLLMQSGNSNDQKIAAAINSNKYNSTQLRQMFPQALGGSY